MGCNASNHPPDCRCGWGGDGHKGKSPGGRRGYYAHLPQSQRNITSKVDTANRLTRCPKCQSEVFFIKYNGGSIWLDPPLGPPWYKHACFDTGHSTSGRGRLKTSFDGLEKGFGSTIKIVVVASCVYNNYSGTTSLKAQFDDSETYSFSVRGDARIFVGRLCFVDPPTKAVWPVDDHGKRLYYQGAFSKHLSSSFPVNGKTFNQKVAENKSVSEKDDFKNIKCKICSSWLRDQKNYKRHLRKIHGVIELSFFGKATGFLVYDESELKNFEGLYDNESERNKKSFSKEELSNSDEIYSLITSSIKAKSDNKGWANLANVGDWIYLQDPLFKPKNHGFKNLSGLIESLDYVEVLKTPVKNNPGLFVVYVRNK
ncbi:OST-HTH/LOTUS domain-containing protein [Halomonas sediminis]